LKDIQGQNSTLEINSVEKFELSVGRKIAVSVGKLQLALLTF